MMESQHENIMRKALDGDLNAFQFLFEPFQDQLKSYLYRLLANRSDAEDLLHDTFIRASGNLHSFKGEASLKTWVFQIGTNLACNYLNRKKRWTEDVSEKAKKLVLENQHLRNEIIHVHETSTYASFEMKEHIDTCFTCISKVLPIENQIAVILKDVYDFSINDICLILDKTEGVIKYLLQDGRKIMTDIFDRRCALVNKNGVCHQCSELNGWFNVKQNQQEEIIKSDLLKGSKKFDRNQLFQLRVDLVKAIDPLRSNGSDLQEILLKCNRMAMNE